MSDQDKKMAAIREKERLVKDQLADPSVSHIVVPGAFFHTQLGLSEALIGQDGRIWVCRGSTLQLVFDRNWVIKDMSHDI